MSAAQTPAGVGEYAPDWLDRATGLVKSKALGRFGGYGRALDQFVSGYMNWCTNARRQAFVRGYIDEQNHIRTYFKRDYMLGWPNAKKMRASSTLGPRFRHYQIFEGGSWGPSSLTQPHLSSPFGRRTCEEKPHLVTGVIFTKWSQIGGVGAIGGPTGGQYWAGPYINQNFERGQLGFHPSNPNDVWWRRGNEGWHR